MKDLNYQAKEEKPVSWLYTEEFQQYSSLDQETLCRQYINQGWRGRDGHMVCRGLERQRHMGSRGFWGS